MSIVNRLRFLRLLLQVVTAGLPYASLAQAGPLPAACWQPGFGVPEGTDGEVWAMVWAQGSLYIGGRFTGVGGVAARNVARWDGHRWHSLGAGDENGVGYRATASHAPEDEVASVRALAVAPNGDVYAGGEFDQAGQVAATCLARWDGRQWSAVGDFLHLEDSIQHHLPAQAARQWAQQHRRVNAGDGSEYVVLDESSPTAKCRHWPLPPRGFSMPAARSTTPPAPTQPITNTSKQRKPAVKTANSTPPRIRSAQRLVLSLTVPKMETIVAPPISKATPPIAAKK